MTVIAVTSLLLEARIATGPGVSVICGHASQLVSCLQAAIKRGALGVISFGVAGGLAPHLAPGDWVIGSGVRTGHERYPADRRWSSCLLQAIPGSVHGEIAGADAPIADASEKTRLHTLTGAMAVDMESHVAAKVAALHHIPFAVCRTVIDPADRDLPPAAVIDLRHDGTPDLLAIRARLSVSRVRSRHSCALQWMPGPPARLCAWAGACWVWGLVALICMNRLAHQPERMFLLRRRCEADSSQDRSRCMQSCAGHAAEPYAML